MLQNRANGAENLIRLCSATIGQTGWRMVQVGAIRSRQKVVQLLAEVLKRREGHERYLGCNLMHCKVLASSHQHLQAEAPYAL